MALAFSQSSAGPFVAGQNRSYWELATLHPLLTLVIPPLRPWLARTASWHMLHDAVVAHRGGLVEGASHQSFIFLMM